MKFKKKPKTGKSMYNMQEFTIVPEIEKTLSEIRNFSY